MTLILKRNSYGAFASKPSTPSQGQLYFATDLGGNGVMMVYSGSIWKPTTGAAVIYQSGVQSTMHTGDTNETNVKIVTIPAGLLSANGGLRITTVWAATGTNNTKTTKIYFSATSGGANGTAIYSIAHGSTALGILSENVLLNRNSASSQIANCKSGSVGFNVATAANTTTAINSASASYLNFTVQLANGADSAGIDAAIVEWIEP